MATALQRQKENFKGFRLIGSARQKSELPAVKIHYFSLMALVNWYINNNLLIT